MMKSLVQKHWDSAHELLGMNAITFPDGNITIFSVCKVYNPNTKEHKIDCVPLCDTTVDSIEKYNHDCWTVVDAWTSVDYLGGKIHGGDGSMGNEGFIACTDATNNLVWGIFFEDTNPIKKLEIF